VTLSIARPTLGEEEADAARQAILSGWVTQGPNVEAFEKAFAEMVGAKHAVAVANCTAALHMALVALGVGPGDEVILPSHSFIATANSVRYTGATPVFVDVEPDGYNLDLGEVERAIGPKTKALLPVHQMGFPFDPRLFAIAKARGIPVVEDAACAIGSEIKAGAAFEMVGRPVGEVACFSFHPRKVITTGDGGMLTTNDDQLDAQFRLLRQHGMSMNDLQRHRAATVVFESYPIVGYNYRMTDIQAAVGRVQLTRLPGFLARRRALADRYAAGLARIAGLEAPKVFAYARPNYQSYPVRVGPAYPLSRDALMNAMLERKISTRRGVMNAHQEPPYAGAATRPLTRSEAARDGVVLLPMFPDMADADADRVLEALADLARAVR
jgi:perosamine synthetase